jgi:hypothetical protein
MLLRSHRHKCNAVKTAAECRYACCWYVTYVKREAARSAKNVICKTNTTMAGRKILAQGRWCNLHLPYICLKLGLARQLLFACFAISGQSGFREAA